MAELTDEMLAKLAALEAEVKAEKQGNTVDTKSVISDKKFGIVLAGGGGKGAYEIGALVALKEAGILDKTVAVSGNSIGSVNMALLAGCELDKARELWENIDPLDFLDFDENGFDVTRQGDGIFSREGLLKLIRSSVDLNKMSESEVKYYVTACTKNDEGEVVVGYTLQNGKPAEVIEQYILASSAIPVIYDSVRVEGLNWFDGGMLDNTPIKPLYDDGIKDIIVISLNNLYESEQNRFPDSKLYNIIPSHTLEIGNIIGTADLSKVNSAYRYKLGYLDCQAYMKSYLEGVPLPDLKKNHDMATRDLNRSRINNSVNDNMAGLERMLGKFDKFTN